MKDIERILFPVDLTDELPEKIIPYVRTMVGSFDAELHIVSVLRDLDHLANLSLPYSEIQEFQRLTREGAQCSLNELRETHFPGLDKVVIVLRTGDAAGEILKYLREAGVDMIIMGTRGRTGMDRLMFGSVANKIVKMSSVPVITINPYAK